MLRAPGRKAPASAAVCTWPPCVCAYASTWHSPLCVSWCFYKNTNVWVRGDPGDLILTRCSCKDLISKWADIDDTETGGSELQSVLLEDSIRASLNRSSLGRFSRRRDFQWLPSWCPQGSSTKTVQTGCSVLTGCSGCQQGLEQTVGWVGSHLV